MIAPGSCVFKFSCGRSLSVKIGFSSLILEGNLAALGLTDTLVISSLFVSLQPNRRQYLVAREPSTHD
jgi:hypothetical protein